MDKYRPSKEYLSHIQKRLQQNGQDFRALFLRPDVEENESGLFALLEIAKNPSEAVILGASCKLKAFVDKFK